MFGINFLQIYFLLNWIYTLFLFSFLHNKIIHMISQRGKKEIQDIANSMPIYYTLSAFLGTLSFIVDLLHCICVPKDSLWLGKIRIKKSRKNKR